MSDNKEGLKEVNGKKLNKEERAVGLSKLKRIELARLLVEISEENDALKKEIAELQVQVRDIKTLNAKVDKMMVELGENDAPLNRGDE